MPVRNYSSFFSLVFKITALVPLQFTDVALINFYILTVVNFLLLLFWRQPLRGVFVGG